MTTGSIVGCVEVPGVFGRGSASPMSSSSASTVGGMCGPVPRIVGGGAWRCDGTMDGAGAICGILGVFFDVPRDTSLIHGSGLRNFCTRMSSLH